MTHHYIKGAVLGLLLLLVGCDSTPKPTLLFYEKHIKIDHQSKFEIQPSRWIPQQTLIVSVSVKSTQNPDMLRTNFKDVTILEDEHGNPIQPHHWEPLKNEGYQVSGELHFPFPDKPSSLSFLLFVPEELRFEWKEKTTP